MPNRSPTDEEIARLPSHYLHELPQEDEERLGKLFAKLDKDGNGKIDIHDLSSALSEHGVHHRYAEVKTNKLGVTTDHVQLFFYFIEIS